MRSLIILLAVAIGAVGCGPLPQPGPIVSGEPIQAYLIPHSSSGNVISFHVNRPAHVAIFRILPGQGTSLVYPTAGYGGINGQTFAGLRRVDTRSMFNRDHFMPRFASAGHDPEFYMLIASEQPLRTERIGAYGYGLRSALGLDFAPMSGYRAMERLASVMIADPAAQNWTTDFYVHWPEMLYSEPRSGLVRVTCGEMTVFVPAEVATAAYQQLCPKDAPEDEVPGDDQRVPDVVEPNRRPPVQVTERITSTQLREPRTFDDLRDAAESDRSGAVERRIARQQAAQARTNAPPAARTAPRARGTVPPRAPSSGGDRPATRERPAVDRDRAAPSSRPARSPSASPARGGSSTPAAAPSGGSSTSGERSRATTGSRPR